MFSCPVGPLVPAALAMAAEIMPCEFTPDTNELWGNPRTAFFIPLGKVFKPLLVEASGRRSPRPRVAVLLFLPLPAPEIPTPDPELW